MITHWALSLIQLSFINALISFNSLGWPAHLIHTGSPWVFMVVHWVSQFLKDSLDRETEVEENVTKQKDWKWVSLESYGGEEGSWYCHRAKFKYIHPVIKEKMRSANQVNHKHTWSIQSMRVCFQYLQCPLYQLRTEDIAQSTLVLKMWGQEFNPLPCETTTKHLKRI